jgi:hypothetical protein
MCETKFHSHVEQQSKLCFWILQTSCFQSAKVKTKYFGQNGSRNFIQVHKKWKTANYSYDSKVRHTSIIN